MLEIQVILGENYDETANKFTAESSVNVCLEHSLVSVSKWESVWEVPFLSDKDKTQKQTLSYVEMMVLNHDLPPGIFHKLVENHLQEVMDYVKADMTATKVPVVPGGSQNKDVHTAELIYYWMITLDIPVEFQHWHLNRLLTLIKVINFKNTPAAKMSPKDRRELNRARRAKLNTTG
jgi:hypothetical protein